jgi:hypothetical protein
MRKYYRPFIEQLGERVMLSGTPLFLPAHVVSLGLPSIHHHHLLDGNGSGTYTGASLIVDAGASYTLQGTAKLVGLGQVTVTSSINGVGMIPQGHATGWLTFTNAHGSVTVELTGPKQPGFASLPEHYSYKVIQGTGEYGNLKHHGTLQLNFVAAPTPAGTTPALTFPTPHGTFTLTLPFKPE